MDDTRKVEQNALNIVKFQSLLARSAKMLCDERDPGDHFFYIPRNASSILRLQLIYEKGGYLKLFFLFPRRSQFKPLYKDVRDWFEMEGLAWKDKQVDGKRYMAAEIPRNPDEIIRLVNAFLKAHWTYDVLNISSERISLLYKLTKLSMRLTLTCTVGILGSILILLFYQITKIGKIGTPSISNISKIEWLLWLITVASSVILNRLLRRQINQRYLPRSKEEEKRLWMWRIGIITSFFLIPSITKF